MFNKIISKSRFSKVLPNFADKQLKNEADFSEKYMAFLLGKKKYDKRIAFFCWLIKNVDLIICKRQCRNRCRLER